ncbi:GLE1-like protein [Artemisia annua]|uniref:GLE1-like protein n=1 Tax=Artemisia annua TaxID=35608 RepID=A0A2U1M1W0_ARTAN|nr:GLE1-like protein [Artemisia annua]
MRKTLLIENEEVASSCVANTANEEPFPATHGVFDEETEEDGEKSVEGEVDDEDPPLEPWRDKKPVTVTMEEIRTRLSAFGTDLINEKDKLSHAISRAEKSKEARHELDGKCDLQFQRQIAEALDNHLTDVQRHHEYKSQIEEKKIGYDAAIEEAKRKQNALRTFIQNRG